MAYLTFRVCHAEDSYGGDSPPVEEWAIRWSIDGDVDWDRVTSELDAHGYEHLMPLDRAPATEWPLSTTVKVSPRKDGVGRVGVFHVLPTRRKGE